MFLREKYKKVIAEKVVQFIENNYQKIMNMDIFGYIGVWDSFLQANTTVHQRFCFNLYDMNNKNNISEHDLFQLLQLTTVTY